MADLLAGSQVVFRGSYDQGRIASPTILVGIGEPAGLAGRSLTLTQKGTGLDAVSDFVERQSDDEIARWAATLGLATDLACPFAGVTLVVEDASPDTCMALILLARRLAGGRVPDPWLRETRRWELGHTSSPAEASWGPHHNALVHALLNPKERDGSVAKALRAGVAYDWALIDLSVDPLALAAHLPAADHDIQQLHATARTQLAYEAAIYRNVAQNGVRLQLAIPFSGSQRRRLVDALFLTDVDLVGALKSFARNDQASWTGDGYLFNAIHRPDLAGTGNDVSFSVDPNAGIDLTDLWAALEKQEWAAWGEERPRNEPRPLVSFAAERADGLQPSNEPWYDGGPAHTLIAAPHALPDGRAGSRLDWAATLEEVWRCYAPGGDLVVRAPGTDAPQVSLLADPQASEILWKPLQGSDVGILDAMRFSGPADPLIIWCPTIMRALAALADGKSIELERLPAEESFDAIRCGGGVVVVTGRGSLLLASERDRLFDRAALRTIIEECASTRGHAIALEGNLAEARARVRDAVTSGNAKTRQRALVAIYRLQIGARQHWPTPAETAGGPLHAVREACERRWRAQERFVAVLDEAKDLESIVNSASSSRSATLLSYIAIYGFPLALFSNVLGAAFQPFGAGDWVAFGVDWAVLLLFLGLSGSIAMSLWLLSRHQGLTWNRNLLLPIDPDTPPT